MSRYKDLLAPPNERPWIVNHDEVEELIAEMKVNQYPRINFQFLNCHTGFKRGCLHLLIGARGRGKSTFMMSVIYAALDNYKVLLYCTEETMKQVNFKLAKMGELEKVKHNLTFISEADVLESEKYKSPVEAIQDISLGKGIDLIFMDNITTSRYYSSKALDIQEKLTGELLKFAEVYNKALFVVAHSNSKTGANDLNDDPSSIRGSSHITIVAQYIYMFKMFDVTREVKTGGSYEDKEIKLAYLKVDKARLGGGTGFYFALEYDKKGDRYCSDARVRYSDYLEAHKDSHKSTRSAK